MVAQAVAGKLLFLAWSPGSNDRDLLGRHQAWLKLKSRNLLSLQKSQCDLPVNMHERLICKDSVKSKCFDEEDRNNKEGGVRKWDKYTIILDYSADIEGFEFIFFLKLADSFPFIF